MVKNSLMKNNEIINIIEKYINLEVYNNSLFIEAKTAIKIIQDFGLSIKNLDQIFDIKYVIIIYKRRGEFFIYRRTRKRLRAKKSFTDGEWKISDCTYRYNERNYFKDIKNYTIKNYFNAKH